MTRRSNFHDHSFGKTPVWWRVWAGICLMVGVGVLALGTWAVVTLVDWITSK